MDPSVPIVLIELDILVADSGYGDGSYPAYWGLDAEGRTAQLVIDFLILTTYDEDGVLRHR
jgi:hypothetical protein